MTLQEVVNPMKAYKHSKCIVSKHVPQVSVNTKACVHVTLNDLPSLSLPLTLSLSHVVPGKGCLTFHTLTHCSKRKHHVIVT